MKEESGLYEKLIDELAHCPTVESGVITVVTYVRWAVEAVNADLDNDDLRALTVMLNDKIADLADAVVHNTPAEIASRAAAARVQRDADKP